MGDNVIGFIGCDKYELILYLSRILFHLNKKVLMVDYSESEALYESIPVPETLRDECSLIDYRGIDFIHGRHANDLILKEYDIVLMDFGFNVYQKDIQKCTKLVYVTDLQRHHVKRLKVMEDSKRFSVDRCLVIKDVFNCKIKPDFISLQFNQVIDQNHVYVLYQDTIDLKYKVQSQYNQIYHFGKLSRPMKYFLKDMAKQIDTSLDERNINNAYKKAERGI